MKIEEYVQFIGKEKRRRLLDSTQIMILGTRKSSEVGWGFCLVFFFWLGGGVCLFIYLLNLYFLKRWVGCGLTEILEAHLKEN